MSLRLLCPDEAAPVPRQVHMELTCDGDHGLFPTAPVLFTQPDYVAQRKAAGAAGWKILPGAGRLDGHRALGPCCSGKTKARETDE